MFRRIGTACLLAILCTASALAQAPKQRHFTFTYAFTVKNSNPGKTLRIWFPMAFSDPFQDVRIISKKCDLPLKEAREPEYGNRIFYAESQKADKPEYHFEIKYDVIRYERLAVSEEHGRANQPHVTTVQIKRFLEPDRLVPVKGRLADIAAKEVAGKSTTVERARALYDYVLRNMRYDKSGKGWGRGDAEWACDAKHGNCTDFHSLFASLARSQGIPTRFAIGFPLPAHKHADQVPGYHCWADFWAGRTRWVPVDISEAWKHPDKRDYFFGAHDENRVQFSVGRDIALVPKQDGEPLNYFIYPYAESGGKEVGTIIDEFSFQDVAEQPVAAARLKSSRSR